MKLVRSFLLSLSLMLLAVTAGWSQSSPAQAFDNVILHTSDGNTIENATVVWRNGLIEAAGSGIAIPFDAYVTDGGDSLHVYPGFIDGLALWGSPDIPDSYDRPDRPGDPGYERAGIQPQRKPSGVLNAKDGSLEEAMKHGFTTAALGLKGHMLPGQVDLFFLNGKQTGDYLMQSGAALLATFENAPGGFGNGAYPATTMGVMAQYRQLWFDADALMNQQNYFASSSDNYPAPSKDEVLESLFPVMQKNKPLFFVADSKENIERIFMLQDELGFNAVLISGEEAYKVAEELKERNIPVLASIDLPEKPKWKVEEEEAADDTTETKTEMEEVPEEMRIFRDKQLIAYQASVDNIRKLLDASVKVGYASNGMELKELKGHLKTLSEEGSLSETDILAMLTRNTADILGIGNRVGDVTAGKIASFSVYSQPITDEEAKVLYSVSAGQLTEFEQKSSK